MIGKDTLRRLEKQVEPGVRPLRVWTRENGKRIPYFTAPDGRYQDEDNDKYQDVEIRFVESDGDGFPAMVR